MTPATVIPGDGPLAPGQPHVGTMVPPEVSVELNDIGRSVPDTDWRIDRLHETIACRTGATVVRRSLWRHVIDVNRDFDEHVATKAEGVLVRIVSAILNAATDTGGLTWRPVWTIRA